MQRFALIVFIVILGISCQKETPYPLPPKGEATRMEVNLGAAYEYQYFIDLKNKTVVHTSRMDQWHLAFETKMNEHGIFINGGNGVMAKNTHKTNLNDVSASDTLEENWVQDDPSGNPDFSALGNWKDGSQSKNTVYLIRMGHSALNMKKIQILSSNEFEYKLIVADVLANSGVEVTVKKNPLFNYCYLDLNLLKEVYNLEPEEDQWDIVFTRYGYTFFDQNPPLPYQVSGVLLNKKNTSAFKDSVTEFYSINADIIHSQPFSTRKDVIGFDWKVYNMDQGKYTVRQDYSYIIHTKKDEYYKLRFLDFYNDQGIKGNPSFELNQIK